MFDRLNGRSKGFAFATFADESGVDNAMAHSGIELEGRSIEIKKAQPRGAGTQVKAFTQPGGARTTPFNATSSFQVPAFDPSAMAMMYSNMMKGGQQMGGMGMMGGGGGFDPGAMAAMYQNMMKSESGVGDLVVNMKLTTDMGMNQAPAINPNMARMPMQGGMMGGGELLQDFADRRHGWHGRHGNGRNGHGRRHGRHGHAGRSGRRRHGYGTRRKQAASFCSAWSCCYALWT